MRDMGRDELDGQRQPVDEPAELADRAGILAGTENPPFTAAALSQNSSTDGTLAAAAGRTRFSPAGTAERSKFERPFR